MGIRTFVSHKVKASELEAGDHIYSWRVGFTYAHHGIYVGEDRVVSVGKLCKPCYSSLAPSTTFPDCGFKKSEESGVIVSCLNCFKRGGSLYRYKYGARRRVYIGKFRGGTCTIAKSDDPKEVIGRAMYLLDNGFAKYHLFRRNCEDFALYCKTGKVVPPKKKVVGCSGQVGNVVAGFTPLRYYLDIGVRKDVKEVKVEDLATFLANGDVEEVEEEEVEDLATFFANGDVEEVELEEVEDPATFLANGCGD